MLISSVICRYYSAVFVGSPTQMGKTSTHLGSSAHSVCVDTFSNNAVVISVYYHLNGENNHLFGDNRNYFFRT